MAEHLPFSSSSSNNEQLDETSSKLVSSIRTLVFESMITQILGNKTTSERVLCKAVACTNLEDSLEQLLLTGRVEDWNELKPTMNYLIYLCEHYRLATTRKQTIIKYISAAITYLIGNANASNEKLWGVIANTIADDCQADKDALGWIIRVLDAFVVYTSGFRSADQFEKNVLLKAICTGLHSILVELRSSPKDAFSSCPLQIADTAYLLCYFINIGNSHKTEQEQVSMIIVQIL